jgi:hypothetical protein
MPTARVPRSLLGLQRQVSDHPPLDLSLFFLSLLSLSVFCVFTVVEWLIIVG